VPIDRKQLPQSAEVLQQMVLDLIAQLDASEARRIKTENLLRQLLAARSGRRSEQITDEQLALFEAELKAQGVNVEELSKNKDSGSNPDDNDPSASTGRSAEANSRGRRALPGHLKRERIIHDLEEAEKHCAVCAQDLREFGEETSERYEFIPAQLIVIEDVCKKYSCACTVKTAGKPSQPIEKSTAGASLLTQVIVAKFADHLPLHRQAKIFRRFGTERPHNVRLDAAMRRVARSSVSEPEGLCTGVEGGGHRRYAGQGAGPKTAADAQRPYLALCGRPGPSGGDLRLHADTGKSRPGEIPERLSRIPAGGCLCCVRQLLQRPAARVG
jgi:transposase